MRTFIAIDLDLPLKKNLEALIEELRLNGKNIRWVNTQGMHLTLKFLGEIPDQDVSRIAGLLENVVKSHSAFDLRLQGAGWFPPGRKNPRVLWVGVEGGPSLGILQKDIEIAVEKLGFAREAREFHPHLTLGRVKLPSGLEPLLSDLEKHREAVFGEMRVSKVTFIKSTLKPSGAEYSILSEFPLR
jgi:RNA 2',3'-cyclic 3'-phosphodiesterase